MMLANLFAPESSEAVCLMLAHSLWEMALLAAAARFLERMLASNRSNLGYAIYVTALVLGFVAMPIT